MGRSLCYRVETGTGTSSAPRKRFLGPRCRLQWEGRLVPAPVRVLLLHVVSPRFEQGERQDGLLVSDPLSELDSANAMLFCGAIDAGEQTAARQGLMYRRALEGVRVAGVVWRGPAIVHAHTRKELSKGLEGGVGPVFGRFCGVPR